MLCKDGWRLWFDVEERYNTTEEEIFSAGYSCGLM